MLSACAVAFASENQQQSKPKIIVTHFPENPPPPHYGRAAAITGAVTFASTASAAIGWLYPETDTYYVLRIMTAASFALGGATAHFAHCAYKQWQEKHTRTVSTATPQEHA